MTGQKYQGFSVPVINLESGFRESNAQGLYSMADARFPPAKAVKIYKGSGQPFDICEYLLPDASNTPGTRTAANIHNRGAAVEVQQAGINTVDVRAPVITAPANIKKFLII